MKPTVADLKKALKSGIVTFTFTKANGELRSASGTLNMNPAIARGYSEDFKPKGNKPTPAGIIVYWDIDKGAWRSCRENSLVEILSISTEDELFGPALFEFDELE
jgi:hypothetical protein